MAAYVLRRLLLMIPTLLGIMLLNFLIVQAAPGGPIDQMLARFEGLSTQASTRLEGGGGDSAGSGGESRGARGVPQQYIDRLETQFGFDEPAYQRFLDMLVDYATFDLGESFFRGEPVTTLMLERLPVSISLGLWTTLLVYLIGAASLTGGLSDHEDVAEHRHVLAQLEGQLSGLRVRQPHAAGDRVGAEIFHGHLVITFRQTRQPVAAIVEAVVHRARRVEDQLHPHRLGLRRRDRQRREASDQQKEPHRDCRRTDGTETG